MSTKESMAAVVDIDAAMPYVEPPAPPAQVKGIYAGEVAEWLDMYIDEAQYHRDRKDWHSAGQALEVAAKLRRIAAAPDPEAMGTSIIRDLSYQLASVREALGEARKAQARQAARDAKVSADNAEVITGLRDEIARKFPASTPATKEVATAAKAIEAKASPKA